MSEAKCGAGLLPQEPGFRYAHPGYGPYTTNEAAAKQSPGRKPGAL